jgi:Zn-dependent protease with chaperone function
MVLEMGIKRRDIKVEVCEEGEEYLRELPGSAGRILFTRKLLNELTPGELDFLLAQRLARFRTIGLSRLLLFAAAAFILLTACHGWLVLVGRARLPQGLRADLTALLLVSVAVLFGFCVLVVRRGESEADLLALKCTRDFHAAMSAIAKERISLTSRHLGSIREPANLAVVQTVAEAVDSALPRMHEAGDRLVEMASEFPALSRRIKALRRSAQDLGLPAQ